MVRRVWRPIRRLWPFWAIAFGLSVVGLILWVAIWVLPPLLVETQLRPGVSATDRLKEIDTVRAGLLGPLGTIVGAAAVLVGAWVAYINFRGTLELNRRGQVTERFTKAIDQLGQAGADNRDIRIGAVYALEQIARDSAELHWPIMEVLTAYLRKHARVRPADGAAGTPPAALRTAADLQAIATVIGRRRQSQDPADQGLDLHEVDLRHVQWARAKLQEANLMGAGLEDANLSDARLKGAYLIGARLERANLHRVKLKDANLGGAQVNGANLTDAKLEGASLDRAELKKALLGGAQLERASLMLAKLQGAYLGRALLNGANLFGAELEGVDLSNVDLTGVDGLTWEQLKAAKNFDLARVPPEVREEAEGERNSAAGDQPAGDSGDC